MILLLFVFIGIVGVEAGISMLKKLHLSFRTQKLKVIVQSIFKSGFFREMIELCKGFCIPEKTFQIPGAEFAHFADGKFLGL